MYEESHYQPGMGGAMGMGTNLGRSMSALRPSPSGRSPSGYHQQRGARSLYAGGGTPRSGYLRSNSSSTATTTKASSNNNLLSAATSTGGGRNGARHSIMVINTSSNGTNGSSTAALLMMGSRVDGGTSPSLSTRTSSVDTSFCGPPPPSSSSRHRLAVPRLSAAGMEEPSSSDFCNEGMSGSVSQQQFGRHLDVPMREESAAVPPSNW